MTKPQQPFKLTRGQKLAWTQALRSGEYAQTSGRLYRAGDYCCLGVLAEASGELDGFGKCQGHICDLPRDILPHDVQSTLMKLNDTECKNFNEIADWIEENL